MKACNIYLTVSKGKEKLASSSKCKAELWFPVLFLVTLFVATTC